MKKTKSLLQLEPLRILSNDIEINFPCEFDDSDQTGESDFERCEIKITGRHRNKKRSLPNVIQTIFHELSHHIDELTGHEIWTDEDKELDAAKEKALDAFLNILIYVLLENNLLNPDWVGEIEEILGDV